MKEQNRHDDHSGEPNLYLPHVAQVDDQIGVADGKGGVISFCCHEGRHSECTGVTEVAMSQFLRIQCVCRCHEQGEC